MSAHPELAPVTVRPSGGDDTATIQTALNALQLRTASVVRLESAFKQGKR